MYTIFEFFYRVREELIVLRQHNQFLEPCCICDSEHTVIGIKEREALGDTQFTYQQLLIRCLDCGFEFVNKELSAQTLKNRDRAERGG